VSTVVGYLVGERGEISGLRVVIPEKGLVIGRDPKQADFVVDDVMVSRRHAQIALAKDAKLYLIDLQSQNGTHVNGRKITAPVALNAGDKVDFGGEGKAVFVFETAGTTSVSGVLKEAFGEKAAPVEWKPGDVVGGKYEVHGTLGKGGFGVVYLAYDRGTGEVCALKTFRDEFLVDGNARDLFKKEALLWVNLDEHPFILPARWVEEFSGRLFVQMDYVAPDTQGRVSLSDHLARAGGPLDVDQALQWAIQFCIGMEHAVSHGIRCHRDIKPANILITQDATLKITDFGLASAAEIAWRTSGGIRDSVVGGCEEDGFGFSVLHADGMVRCGTPGYMPPEVFRGETADIRSDIYSFGLVLWQMGTGSRNPPFVVPFRGDMGSFLRGVYEQQMTDRLPRISRPLWPVVKRCLKAKPTKRYSDFGELRDDLAAIFRKRTGRTVRVPDAADRNVAFWNSKGASLDALGQHEDAIGCFDKALAIDLRCATAWTNKGLALIGLGRKGEAISCYDQALAIDPRFALAWNNKGLALAVLGRFEEALRCYNQALAIDPRFALAWDNKGLALAALGRFEEAISCYDHALAIDPRFATACIAKGLALAALDRFEEAISCCDQALAIDPRDAAAWDNKGSALAALGRFEEALRCYDQALAIDPRFATAWDNKGLALDDLGRHEDAISCYDQALAIDPRLATARITKGLALAALGRFEEALRCYDQALAIDPRLALAWDNKGLALAALGRFEEAISCCDQALAIDPRLAAAWYNKALTEDTTGKSSEAVRSYRRFTELAPSEYVNQIAHARQRLKELGR
jgi:tetratricopeptide (TPR) repeat protein